MSRNNILIGIGAVVVVGLVAVGALIYWVLGPTQAASGPIEAVPLATSASSSQTVFQIVPASSEARFSIFEELGGRPNTVVGKTTQVAGEIAVNLKDLSQTQVGVIKINARTFATDSNQRNRAIQNRILNTNSFEFVTFTPKQVTGLSGSAAPGQTFTFQIAGDLTVRDVTQPVVFAVTAKADSATKISGSAKATIKRADYNLVVPSVPNVANVGEEVTLELDFVAELKAGG